MKQKALLIFILISSRLFSQTEQPVKIYISDITNFWVAYDSVVTTTDTLKQLKFIQALYIDKATLGLIDLINARNYTANKWVKIIKRYPRFWLSIRPQTLGIESKKGEIKLLMSRFKNLYPCLNPLEIYFTIGGLNTGGTTSGNRLLIGAEIACADSTVNASELSHWHKEMFKANSDLLEMVAHESVHIQQKEDSADANLLNASIYEGSCDFVAELLLGRPLITPYLTYGKKNHNELFKKFHSQIYQQDFPGWLYNGDNVPAGQADLGYYIGYAICKSYYDNAENKSKAFADIIQLDYTDKKRVYDFYSSSIKFMK